MCHQDDVLKTSIQPGDAAVRISIPNSCATSRRAFTGITRTFTASARQQVLGGASGALIIEGIERANPASSPGLPERVLVIRDQDLLNPDAPPSKDEPVVPKMLIDRDGDAANNGTGFGKPAKDLSINYVPVPYPDYPPASIAMRPGERQLWRVVNASAITYLNLAVIFQHAAAKARHRRDRRRAPEHATATPTNAVEWRDHIGLAAGRARGVHRRRVRPQGVPALLVTRTVDTGQGGENDPNRALASIVAARDAPEPRSILPSGDEPLAARLRCPGSANVAPVRVRKLYFSEKLTNPADPNSATEFYLTVDGQTPKLFDPASTQPEHRGPAGRRRGLDHREPLDRAARVSHPSAAFSAARLVGRAGQRAVPARYRQRAVLQRPRCSSIRACGCAWIFAIPNTSALSSTTAICSSTKTAA